MDGSDPVRVLALVHQGRPVTLDPETSVFQAGLVSGMAVSTVQDVGGMFAFYQERSELAEAAAAGHDIAPQAIS